MEKKQVTVYTNTMAGRRKKCYNNNQAHKLWNNQISDMPVCMTAK